MDPIVAVSNLHKQYIQRRGWFSRASSVITYAVTDVSFAIPAGKTLGLVGESGCGKSTIGKTLLRLISPTMGSIAIRGQDVMGLGARDLRAFRRHMQIIFQDPYSSLSPRMRVRDIVGEPLRIHESHTARSMQRDRVVEMLKRVGLSENVLSRFPHEFSGGQRQRIGIARAMILHPEFVVCDEPVSSLDVSIQSQILNLLKDLQDAEGATYLFISHDLRVIEFMAHEVMVMYLGRIMEYASRQELFANPLHPYTQSLLSAVPQARLDRKRTRVVLQGDVPSPRHPPSGCVFRTRCPIAEEQCKWTIPPLREVRPGHKVACLLVK